MGFADLDRAALVALRRNLLAGLDRVAVHVEAGTLDVVPAGDSTPPAASGWLMTVLLAQVNGELRRREVVVPTS